MNLHSESLLVTPPICLYITHVHHASLSAQSLQEQAADATKSGSVEVIGNLMNRTNSTNSTDSTNSTNSTISTGMVARILKAVPLWVIVVVGLTSACCCVVLLLFCCLGGETNNDEETETLARNL